MAAAAAKNQKIGLLKSGFLAFTPLPVGALAAPRPDSSLEVSASNGLWFKFKLALEELAFWESSG